MLAVNYSTIRNNLKAYCDEATDRDETEYLAMIDRGIAQLSSGKGQKHELIEVEDDE